MGDSSIPAHMDAGEHPPSGDLIDAEGDSVIQPAHPLPEPKIPSAAEVAAHNLTHLPYRSWCPHCVAGRRPNSHHRHSSSPDQRASPLLAADYCFIRDNDDAEPVTVLVARLYPSRALLATVVDSKGIDPVAVARLARFIRDSGYSKIIYKTDQEKPIVALFEETFQASARQGVLHNPTLTQMVPEASAVGESQSNGKAENAVQTFEDLLRTYKSALETRLECRIPVKHPIMRWMTEHVSSVTNRHVCNPEGQTPYESIHGQRFKGKAVEFGERVFYFVPRKLRAKLNLRWRIGTFIGNAQSTNEAYVAVSNGDVIKSRSLVRVVSASRWVKDAVLGVKGLPHRFRVSQDEQDDTQVEELQDPHDNLDAPDAPPEPSDSKAKGKRKLTTEDTKQVDIRITANDIERFGYSDDCPRCQDLEGKGKSYRHHNDACRLRFYLEFKESNHPKWRAVKHLFDEDKDAKFSSAQVDPERAPKTPRADLSTNLFEEAPESPRRRNEPNSVNDDFQQQAEDLQLSEAVDASMREQEEQYPPDIKEMDEDELADMFGDFNSDMEDGDEPQQMQSALRIAGVTPSNAQLAVSAMTSPAPPSTFVEVYGTSIFDHNLMSRRNRTSFL